MDHLRQTAAVPIIVWRFKIQSLLFAIASDCGGVAAHSGDQVTILLRRGTLTLSAPGQLLQDGRIGDTIQVANQVTKTAIRGVLTEPGLVEIQ